MILQALKEYYDRKAQADSDVAPLGWEWKEIPLVLILNPEGLPVSLNLTFEGEGKKRRAKAFLVPQGIKRAVNVVANLLWDNPEYCLGIVLKGNPDRVCEQHRSFIEKVHELSAIDDDGLRAVCRFLERPDKLDLIWALDSSYRELIEEGHNLTFQLQEDLVPVFGRTAVKRVIDSRFNLIGESLTPSICLVTGKYGPTARLHDPIKGVWGAQSSGANIISFNLASFRSWGKEQGANASISIEAMTAYTKALNMLLAKDSSSRMQVGDSSTVFWAERNENFTSQFASFFNEPSKDDPDSGARAVAALYQSLSSGAFNSDDSSGGRFFVLGLAPNSSRIAIRFWIMDTIVGMSGKIARHFQDLSIVHGSKDRDVLSLFRLLVSIAPLGKSENIPPNLAGELMRSVLEGLPYPQTLLQATLRRIKAEQAKKNKQTGRSEDNVTYERAALIKACINRAARVKNPTIEEELHMSLDEQNTNIGYRLGRLFATLEKIQSESHPGINATIRDRFYGSASGTPITVFGNLMRLKNHHLAKLENPGRRVNFERLISSILDGVDANKSFPPHLSLEDQGRFAIGYYHQMQDFFTKKENKNQGENHE